MIWMILRATAPPCQRRACHIGPCATKSDRACQTTKCDRVCHGIKSVFNANFTPSLVCHDRVCHGVKSVFNANFTLSLVCHVQAGGAAGKKKRRHKKRSGDTSKKAPQPTPDLRPEACCAGGSRGVLYARYNSYNFASAGCVGRNDSGKQNKRYGVSKLPMIIQLQELGMPRKAHARIFRAHCKQPTYSTVLACRTCSIERTAAAAAWTLSILKT